MTSNGYVPAPTGTRQVSSLSIEVDAYFRFLDVDVHVVCDSVRQLQYWTAMYTAFTTHPTRDPDVVIRTHGDASWGTLTAEVTVDGATTPWSSGAPLLPPLELPLFDGWVHLHASTVARAGHGLLLLGPAGSGKTTLALAAVARGALLVADGVVPVAVSDLLAHPFPSSLLLRRSELELLSIPASHPALRPFRSKEGDVLWRADPRALLHSHAARTATEVAAIVLLEPPGEDGAPELRPVLPEDALVALVRYLHTRPQQRREALDALVRLAGTVPSYALRTGSPRDTAELLDRLLMT